MLKFNKINKKETTNTTTPTITTIINPEEIMIIPEEDQRIDTFLVPDKELNKDNIEKVEPEEEMLELFLMKLNKEKNNNNKKFKKRKKKNKKKLLTIT